jgi:hypothetical protein
MKVPCGNSHPLYNPGSTQSARAPEPLDPKATVFDERTVSDWLVFLSKYAKHINFFALKDEETASDTWARFFDHDVSVLLARLAEEQTDYLQRTVNTGMSTLAHADLTAVQARKEFTLLFAHLFNIIYRLNGYYLNLEAQLDIKEDIRQRIFTQIEPRLVRLVAYFKAAQDEGLIDAAADQNLPNDYLPTMDLANWDLLKVWHPSSVHDTWSDFIGGTAADSSPFESNVLSPTNDAEKINLAVRYQLFAETVKGLLAGFVGIVTAGRKAFDETIENWPDHQPDRALLIAFLRLLELYRDEINTFNTRHLDHYYKDVLQLKPKAAVADSVFLVAELAKNKSEARLTQGTEFSGGKDDEGVERIYAADEETIINQAHVSAQKAVIKSGDYVYAAQNVATSDGIDGELEFPENGWPAFGSASMPEAKMGFAIVSDHLFMQDGTRQIDVFFASNQSWNISEIRQIFNRAEAQISGESGWVSISGIGSSLIDDELRIRLTVEEEEEAIVAVDGEVHERAHYPELPVLEFYFASEDLTYLQELKINSVRLNIDVQDCQHKEVITQQGTADVSKPFQAFGPIPTKGSAIVIGVQEMAAKSNVVVTVKNTWLAKTADEKQSVVWNSIPLEIEQRSGNGWISSESVSNRSEVNYALQTQSGAMPSAFSPRAKRGYVRLRLTQDLEHKGYPNELAKKMAQIAIDENLDPDDVSIPLPYYIPTLEKLRLDYTAATNTLSIAKSASYQTEGTSFYHITPFGAYEASGNVLDVEYPGLVPEISNEGELYIGFENAKGGSRINLLIQVLEGSANPLKAKQDVTWNYLHNNRWVEFESGDLVDGTDGLIKSGIVQFALPFGFEDTSSFFDGSFIWIRATVKQHTDAVCRIIGLHAQALKATLSSTGHSNTHYLIPLEAQSVSKLKTSNAAFKKFVQPVAATGGKATESPDKFYTRTSERLRHKQRSVSAWDYERLVLQEFPALSKAKALSHTRYYVDPVSNEVEYSESAPGNLAVVCVPQKAATFEPDAKPYTPIDTLEEVEIYLNDHLPDWATLHVRNPIFEEVEIDCRVEFLPTVKDKEYYKTVLIEDLKGLLSPWRGQAGSELRFDWRIHKSEIIDFIDERPYVDYVRDLKLNVIYGTADEERDDDVNEAIPRYAVSVLISASNHQVDLVTP